MTDKERAIKAFMKPRSGFLVKYVNHLISTFKNNKKYYPKGKERVFFSYCTPCGYYKTLKSLENRKV